MKQRLILITVSFLTTFFAVIPIEAQWVQTNGPDGSQVNCFATIGSRLLAGTGHGVFISTDKGTS